MPLPIVPILVIGGACSVGKVVYEVMKSRKYNCPICHHVYYCKHDGYADSCDYAGCKYLYSHNLCSNCRHEFIFEEYVRNHINKYKNDFEHTDILISLIKMRMVEEYTKNMSGNYIAKEFYDERRTLCKEHMKSTRVFIEDMVSKYLSHFDDVKTYSEIDDEKFALISMHKNYHDKTIGDKIEKYFTIDFTSEPTDFNIDMIENSSIAELAASDSAIMDDSYCKYCKEHGYDSKSIVYVANRLLASFYGYDILLVDGCHSSHNEYRENFEITGYKGKSPIRKKYVDEVWVYDSGKFTYMIENGKMCKLKSKFI